MSIHDTHPNARPSDGAWPSAASATINTSSGLEDLSLSVRLGAIESGDARTNMAQPEVSLVSESWPGISWSSSVDLKREVEAVSIRDMLKSDPEKAMKLFDQCYDLYVKAFPDPNEIQSPEVLLRALKRESRLWDMIAAVEGDRALGARHMTLLQSNHPEIGAFIAGEHVYVDQSERKRGIAKTLIAHTENLMRSVGAKLAISEQNDPNAMSPQLLALDAQSGITTRQRLHFWKNLGYEGIDAPYVQPPLEGGKSAVQHLRIAIRRLDPSVPDSLPTEGYIQMLKAYQSAWVNDIDSNPLVKAYCDAIRREHPHRVPIIDLEEPRACVRWT
jgi:GNAT superfamily N-acetyltransferase